MEFRELSDEQWQFIQPLLPPAARTGRPRADDRRTLNGILYVLVTGCRWMDMPKEYGSHKTAWRRLVELGYQAGRLELGAVAVDATTIEARRGEAVGVDGFRRRKGSKVHALVAPPGLPLAVAIGPANSHDATVLPQLMAGLRLGGRRGRPRRRPEELCADGAYDTREVRRHLRRRGIRASIRENPRGQRQPRRDRPVDLLGHLPGGEGGGRALLRLAQGRVLQAGPAVRAALDHLRPPGLPGLLPRRLEAFEMSPY